MFCREKRPLENIPHEVLRQIFIYGLNAVYQSTTSAQIRIQKQLDEPQDEVARSKLKVQLESLDLREEITRFVNHFSCVSKNFSTVAKNRVLLLYADAFLVPSLLDQALATYFAKPLPAIYNQLTITKQYLAHHAFNLLDLKLLLNHPFADPNLLVVVDGAQQPLYGNGKLVCFRENEENRRARLQQTELLSSLRLDRHSRAKPITFLAVIHKDMEAFKLLLPIAKPATDMLDYVPKANRRSLRPQTTQVYCFDLESKDLVGHLSLLLQVLITGHQPIVNLLLKYYPVLVNTKLKAGQIPECYFDSVDASQKEEDIELTPLQYFINVGDGEVVKLLRSKGATTLGMQLEEIVRSANLDLIKTFCHKEGFHDFDNKKIVQQAISSKNIEVLKYVLSAHSAPSKMTEEEIFTFLLSAIKYKNFYMFCILYNKYLCENSHAKVLTMEFTDSHMSGFSQGKTLLHFAVIYDQVEIAAYIITQTKASRGLMNEQVKTVLGDVHSQAMLNIFFSPINKIILRFPEICLLAKKAHSHQVTDINSKVMNTEADPFTTLSTMAEEEVLCFFDKNIKPQLGPTSKLTTKVILNQLNSLHCPLTKLSVLEMAFKYITVNNLVYRPRPFAFVTETHNKELTSKLLQDIYCLKLAYLEVIKMHHLIEKQTNLREKLFEYSKNSELVKFQRTRHRFFITQKTRTLKRIEQCLSGDYPSLSSDPIKHFTFLK